MHTYIAPMAAKRLSPATCTWLKKCGFKLAAIATMVALFAPAAMAGSGAGTLTDVANTYKATSAGWISTALGYATHLFLALVAIELAWTSIPYALQRDSLSDFVAQLVLKLMGVFFFLALLQNAPIWIPYIIDSFSQAGATIGGHQVVLDPSSTFSEGLQLAKNMLGTVNNPSFFTAMLAVLIAVLSAIGVVVAFGVVAGQLMVTLIESYIVVSAGIFFLGFSGSRWTLPFSEKYVAYAVSVGIKLFMLYLIVGLGQALASQWAALFTPGVIAAPDVYIGVAGSALIFMLLGWHIPGLAASFMNGSTIMTLGSAASTIGTSVASGAALATGGLAAAGALVSIAMNSRKLEEFGQAASTDGVGVITGERAAERVTPSALGPTAQQQAPPTATTAAGDDTKERLGDPVGSQSSQETGEKSQSDQLAQSAAEEVKRTPTSSGGGDESIADTNTQAISQTARPAKTRPSQSHPRRSFLDSLRGMRPPVFPNDAGSGAIHIRFKHHDQE